MADQHEQYFDRVEGIAGEKDLLEHIYHTEGQLQALKNEHPNDATYRVLHHWLTLITRMHEDEFRLPENEIAFQYRLIDEADELDQNQKDTIRDSYRDAFGDNLQDALNANPVMGGGKRRKQKQRKTRARKHRKQRKTRKGRK